MKFNKFNVSLCCIFILDFLVVGPWKDPNGYSFPKSRAFSDSGRMPLLFDGLRVHFGLIITLIFNIYFLVCFFKNNVWFST